ncbi:MAG: CHAT domain-containing protein [Gammaproteobacteria bacterium]|nr:CHAT domain-containing protein [Gammaproteobacteria bacterium]
MTRPNQCRHGAIIALWVLMGSLLVLGGCASGGGANRAESGLPIGARLSLPAADSQALGDVACEFYKSGGDNGDLEQFDIRCPGWDRPAGTVWRGDIPRSASHWENRLFTDGNLGATIRTEASCGAAETTQILGEYPAVVYRCTSYNGGFPYLFIAAGIANHAFVLWGPAHLAPLFEGLVRASLADSVQTTLPGTRSELIALAEQAVSPDGHFIGLEDMGQFSALDELSTLYNSAKNHERALELARRALEIHERIKGPDDPSGGYLVARIARELSRLQPGAAKAMLDRAEPLVKASSDPSDYPEFLVYSAWYELEHGDPARAESLVQQSRELSEKAAARSQQGEINPRIAHSLIGVGDVYVALNKLPEAESAYLQALKIYDKLRGGDYHWVGETHQRLADIYRRQQAFSKAREHAQAAVDLARQLFGEGQVLVNALMEQARVEQAAGQPQLALSLWREALRILREDSTARAQLRTADIEGYLELLFDLAGNDPTHRQALLDEAFTVSQLGQTPAAGRAITQLAARLAESDPEVRDTARALQDALKNTQDLQYALGVEQSKPYLERNTAKEEDLKNQLREASVEYQKQEERLQSQFPRYGRLITPNPLSTAQVSASLKPGEALVRVLPGADATWVFLVTTDGQLQAVEVPLTVAELAAQVKRLRAGVDASSGHLPTFDVALAYRVYQELFGSLEPQLANVENLIVVPAGPLLSLPPAMLVRQPPVPGLRDYRQAAWLVRDMATSLLPSVVALEQFRQIAGTSQAKQPFIGFGDPVFTNAAVALRGNTPDSPQDSVEALVQSCQINAQIISRLPRLPETADELGRLARILGANPNRSIILGQEATIPTVENSHLKNYRVIAFATHALLPGELDCLAEPALALTPQAGPGLDSTGLLSASEIANLNLDADWVLLSACNTAGEGGGNLRGEGLSGLATAFFYAGARTLLASHWYVVSEPTVILTTTTFDTYRKSPQQGRAQALRAAQLKLLSDPNTAHPLFWAAFTLIGESSRS